MNVHFRQWNAAASRPVFDLSRQDLLSYELQDIRLGQQLTQGSTHSRFRMRPNTIRHWTNFPQDVMLYWSDQVPDYDKDAMVHSLELLDDSFSRVDAFVFSTEQDIKNALQAGPFSFHRAATRSDRGQPLPQDAHSEIQWLDSGAMGLEGLPDYCFKDVSGQRVTAVMDAKTPWLVTPDQIDAVLNGTIMRGATNAAGTASQDGNHAGRLAVEQVYGYMVRNHKVLGIITTFLGWVFLRRENGGRLLMTRMFACANLPRLRRIGYSPPTFTISMALYYFSSIAESTPDLYETVGNPPQLAHFPMAGVTTAAAPWIQPPLPREFRNETLPEGYQYPLPYPDVQNWGAFLMEPWGKADQLGPKTWVASLHAGEGRKKVIVKLWDSWRMEPANRDKEVEIYKGLESLWGMNVPSLFAFGAFCFSHALVVDYIDAPRLSAKNISPAVEEKVVKAFDEIHARGVLHDDVRAANVLVGSDERVWIIDFEYSHIIDGDENSDKLLTAEKRAVRDMLASVKLDDSKKHTGELILKDPEAE